MASTVRWRSNGKYWDSSYGVRGAGYALRGEGYKARGCERAEGVGIAHRVLKVQIIHAAKSALRHAYTIFI